MALVALIAGCGHPSRPVASVHATRSQPEPQVRRSGAGVRECSTGDLPGPDLAVDFDVFVAADTDLDALFPYALRQLPAPVTAEGIEETRWPPYIPFDLRTVVAARSVLWVECGNLFPDGFEALGDALGVARPEPTHWPGHHDVTLDRLVQVLYFKPEDATFVSRFPTPFLDALAGVANPATLGSVWAETLRSRRLRAADIAKSEGFPGREDPPLDLAEAQRFLSKLAADLVELAKVAKATERGLYVHFLAD
jgi:hypothetical protein